MDAPRKKPGRPRVDATQLNVRMPPGELAALDAWIAEQADPKPTRPEALRILARGGKRGRGRPISTGEGKLIGLRWHEPLLSEIEAWAAQQDDKPERSVAIRRLVERGLKYRGK
jgi:hypothetical protein